MNHKPKAPRNRTISITPEEIDRLRGDFFTPEQAADHLWVDTLVLADAIDVLQSIPTHMADLIIVDPPYNLTKQYADTRFSASSSKDYEQYLRQWIPQLCAKLKPHGTLYMCCDWQSSPLIYNVLSESLHIINRITWQREKGRGSKRNWKNGMEDIWMAVAQPKNYYFNPEPVKLRRRVLAPYRLDGRARDWQQEADGKYRLTYASNFWDDMTVPFWSMPENTPHPTQKPEKLIAKLMLASSKPGDMVLDIFGGSGTTAVVARKLGRRFCIVEREELYCLYAAKRLRNALVDNHIQGYDDGVFLERNA